MAEIVHKPIPFPSNVAWTGCTRKSYNKMADWAVIIILLAIETMTHFYNNENAHNAMCVPGFNGGCQSEGGGTHVSQPDPNIDHPVVDDTVPFGTLAALTIFGYFFIFWINAAILNTYDSVWKDNSKLQVVLIKGEVLLRSVLKAFAFSTLTVEIVKNWVGRPRPNYLNDTAENQQYDAARSFPSGHSAFAVALLGLLSLYFFRTLLSVQGIFYYSKHAANQEEFDEAPQDFEVENEFEIEMKKVLNIYNGDSYMFLALFLWLRHCQMLSLIIAMSPFILALYVCCTRIEDYKHHYSDVLAGAFVGLIYAVMSFVYYQGEFYYGFEYDMDKILTDLGASVPNSDELEVVVKEQEDMAIMMQENADMKA